MPRWVVNLLKGGGCLIILLIAAAILFPVFAHRHDHDPPWCLSHEKMLVVALIQYAQDYENCLPNIADTSGSNNTWRQVVSDYVKNASIYQYPERDDKEHGPDGFPRS